MASYVLYLLTKLRVFLASLPVFGPIFQVESIAIYVTQEDKFIKKVDLRTPKTGAEACAILTRLNYEGNLFSQSLFIEADEHLVPSLPYQYRLTRPAQNLFATAANVGIRLSVPQQYQHLIAEKLAVLQEPIWDSEFEDFFESCNFRRTMKVRILECATEVTKESRLLFYGAFRDMLEGILAKIRHKLPFAHLMPASTTPKSLIDQGIGVSQNLEPDLTWAGLQQALLIPNSAYTSLKGIVEMKAIDYTDDKLVMEGLVQLSSVTRAVAQKRSENGMPNHLEPVVGLYSDGRRVGGVRLEPSATGGTLYYTHTLHLTAGTGVQETTPDMPAFKLVVWFLYMSERLNLRAAALAALEDLRRKAVWRVRTDNTTKDFKMMNSSLGRGVFLLEDASSSTYIAKASPSPGLLSALQAMGEHSFGQASNEEVQVKKLKGVAPALPIPVVSGTEEASGFTVIVTAFQGKQLEKPITDALQSIELTEAIITAIACLQEANLSHNDISPRNVVFDGEKFTIIDLGFATELGASLPRISLDMTYASTDILTKRPITVMSDPESAAYTILALHGRKLPWEEAAVNGQTNIVLFERRRYQQKVEEVVKGLPIPARRFVTAVFKGMTGEKPFDLQTYLNTGEPRDSAFEIEASRRMTARSQPAEVS